VNPPLSVYGDIFWRSYRVFMKEDIETAKYLEGYKIELTFKDGKRGILDFQNSLNGTIFGPLKNIESFKKFFIHPEVKILPWENGADIAPEFAYENARYH
jgi:hypothetical protein